MSEQKGALSGLQLDQQSFLGLMKQVIGVNQYVQNSPPNLIPQEEKVADLVVEYLRPYTKPEGPLIVRKLTYVEGRSNVYIKYEGTTDKIISFVGCHMDVVPANPEEWNCDPFSLGVDGDKLTGRGVTDCLGHVCLVADFFRQLAIQRPSLKHSIVGIFIANEEASDTLGIGIDEMQKRGELDNLKNGKMIWLDTANFGPTLGTAGMLTWELTARGKKFHSGLPHKGVNAVELANEAVKYMQQRFYQDFSQFAEEEKKYLFQIGSSLKPTRTSTPPGSINQIPGECTISGDIRITPFYNSADVREKVESYVKEINVNSLPTYGPSRFTIEDCQGTVEIKFPGNPFHGVAVDMTSQGYSALLSAVQKNNSEAKPFSLTGSLPIIRGLKDSGFDVQMTGFGRLDAYHANNEFAFLSDYVKGARVLADFVDALEL